MKTVYLDSQDFSHFSSRHKDYGKYADLKSELLKLQNDGKARFVFSDIHFYEVYPIDGKATKEGLERICTISEFCGRNSLPSIFSLLEYEVKSEFSRKANKSLPHLSTNWFPDIGIRNNPPERPESINRELRRKLTKEFRKSEILPLLHFVKNPNILLKYQIHEVEWNDVVDMIEDGILDIKSFSQHLIENPNENLNIPEILRDGYTSYISATRELMQVIETYSKDAPGKSEKKALSKTIYNAIESAEANLRDDAIYKILPDIGNINEINTKISVNKEMPCFDSLIKYMVELTRRSSRVQTPRSPIGSDFADALHMAFLPKVDIFRTDAAAADALKTAHPDRAKDIVSDVFQLPNLIMAA